MCLTCGEEQMMKEESRNASISRPAGEYGMVPYHTIFYFSPLQVVQSGP
jgi:hypothetical protein